MIEVQMTNDIRKFETKTFGMFTTRQVVCIILGLVVSIPFGIFLPIKELSNRIFVIGIIAVPFILCGYIKIDNCPLEFIALRWAYQYILTPRKRKCIRINYIRDLCDQYDQISENQKLSKMTPKEQKKYYKNKNQKVKVKYSKKSEYRGFK